MSGLPSDVHGKIAAALASGNRAAAADLASKIAAAQASGDAWGFGDDVVKLQALAGIPVSKTAHGAGGSLAKASAEPDWRQRAAEHDRLRKALVDDALYTEVQAAIFGRDAVAARALYPRFKAVVDGDPTNAMFVRDLASLGMLAGDPMAGKMAPDVLARAAVVVGLAKAASTDQERAIAKHHVDTLAGDIRVDLEIKKIFAAPPKTMGACPS